MRPWLKKPLWVVLQEDCGQQINTSEVELHQRSPSRSQQDDTTEDTGEGAFSLEYPNDDDDDQAEEEDHHNQHQLQQNQTHNIHDSLPSRHLSLFDLVSIGVGGTIGSGIFVLNGLIAHSYAGPATFISWIVSGIAALLSGCCYAELSGRIPSAGSSYAYAFVALGELPAFITAFMLTLEFLLSGSAVARSWGDKVVEWLRVELSVSEEFLSILEPGYGINPMACLVSIVTTLLVLWGVKESKLVTDFFTWIKVFLVIFMTVGGFILFNPANMTPLVPPEFGAAGILRGSVSSFFGYLGFDAVCCVAGEAINPERNLPLSIVITLCIVTFLYIAAAISLVGMQYYTDISPESGFPEAFKSNNVEWAAQLTAAGEVATLPVVVLISIIIQPRLQFAMANDGILVAFTITNCSLVVMRRESLNHRLEKLLALFNAASFFTCMMLSHVGHIGWIFTPLPIYIACKISRTCPPTSFGNTQLYRHDKYFTTPMVPYVPCLGMFVNYFLIAQLSMFGIGCLVIYASVAVVLYFAYGSCKKTTRRWDDRQYSQVDVKDGRIIHTANAVIT
eukprot:scaffold804_cov85-Skeletonema_dohrnii-CCMP3373.AAC.14